MSAMPGQGIIGQTCAWCELPATGDIEVEAAETKAGELLRAARVVPACDEHRAIPTGGGLAPNRKMRSKARGVDQLDIFAAGASTATDAIRGER